MRSEWFGDSYDIVKRFFVTEITALGYAVFVNPMASGNWAAVEPDFLRLLGARHVRDAVGNGATALLIDPDTGLSERGSASHATFDQIIAALNDHDLVIVFDQSISRAAAPLGQLTSKLRRLDGCGVYAFYYDSHARFLFASRSPEPLAALRAALVATGLPDTRLVSL
jgi:hypothetical protein